MTDKHRAAVDRLVEERAALLDQVNFTQGTLASVGEALTFGIDEVETHCGARCPSLGLLYLTKQVVTELALRTDWVDYLHDAVGGVDE